MFEKEGGTTTTHSVDTLQEDIAQDIKGHGSARLDTSVCHAVACVCESQILFLQGELVPTDCEAHDGELVDGGVGGVGVPLLRGVVFTAWDGGVDGFAGGVVDEGEGRSGVGDGGVVGTFDRLAGYDCGGAGEHPEALGVVDGGVVGGLAAEGVLVDVAEGVEGFAFVWITCVFDGAEVGGEELGCFGDVVLGDHVLDGSLDWGRGDCVDGSPGQAAESVTGVLLELGRECFG